VSFDARASRLPDEAEDFGRSNQRCAVAHLKPQAEYAQPSLRLPCGTVAVIPVMDGNKSGRVPRRSYCPGHRQRLRIPEPGPGMQAAPGLRPLRPISPAGLGPRDFPEPNSQNHHSITTASKMPRALLVPRPQRIASATAAGGVDMATPTVRRGACLASSTASKRLNLGSAIRCHAAETPSGR